MFRYLKLIFDFNINIFTEGAVEAVWSWSLTYEYVTEEGNRNPARSKEQDSAFTTSPFPQWTSKENRDWPEGRVSMLSVKWKQKVAEVKTKLFKFKQAKLKLKRRNGKINITLIKEQKHRSWERTFSALNFPHGLNYVVIMKYQWPFSWDKKMIIFF